MHNMVTRKTAKSISVTPKTTTLHTVSVKLAKSNTLHLKLSAAPCSGDKGCTGPARYESKVARRPSQPSIPPRRVLEPLRPAFLDRTSLSDYLNAAGSPLGPLAT